MKWAMEKWQAVVIAVLLYIPFFFIPLYLGVLIIVLSSLWASFDAGKIGAKRYHSGLMPHSPAGIFVGCLLLWIVVFPWYLYFRSHIKAGCAPELSQGGPGENYVEELEAKPSNILPDMLERD